MDGNATLTIVTSIPTSRRLMQMPSTRFCRTDAVVFEASAGPIKILPCKVEDSLDFSFLLIYEGALDFCKSKTPPATEPCRAPSRQLSAGRRATLREPGLRGSHHDGDR